jgi:TolB-like protein
MPEARVEAKNALPREEVLAHLERVLASAIFADAPKLRDILRFVVRETLEGRGSRIKEYNIGLDVYSKDAHYDPSRHPVIRTAVGRLRAKLENYYRTAAPGDGLRIEIPRREYAAVFRRLREVHRCESCAVLPFLDFRRREARSPLGDGVADELIHALGRVEGLRVAARTSSFAFRGAAMDAVEIARRLGVTRIVEGSVRRASGRTELTVRLIDAADGIQLWSGKFSGTPRELEPARRRMIRAVAAALRRIGHKATVT